MKRPSLRSRKTDPNLRESIEPPHQSPTNRTDDRRDGTKETNSLPPDERRTVLIPPGRLRNYSLHRRRSPKKRTGVKNRAANCLRHLFPRDVSRITRGTTRGWVSFEETAGIISRFPARAPVSTDRGGGRGVDTPGRRKRRDLRPRRLLRTSQESLEGWTTRAGGQRREENA